METILVVQQGGDDLTNTSANNTVHKKGDESAALFFLRHALQIEHLFHFSLSNISVKVLVAFGKSLCSKRYWTGEKNPEMSFTKTKGIYH